VRLRPISDCRGEQFLSLMVPTSRRQGIPADIRGFRNSGIFGTIYPRARMTLIRVKARRQVFSVSQNSRLNISRSSYGMTNVEIEDVSQGSNLYLLHSVEFFQPCPTHPDRARNISTPSGHQNFSLRPIMASVELGSYFRCSLVTIPHPYSFYR